MGPTMAPTMLWGSNKRNVMPARATVEVDCRILPGTTPAEVETRVRALLGDDLPYDLEWPEEIVEASSSPVDGVVPSAVAAFLAEEGDPASVLPTLCTGFTDSNYLRAAGGTAAYGFSPFRSHARPRCWTPATTTPTSGSTSTTCCCRPASTSTSPAASSADRVSTAFPEPASTPDLRGLMLDYLDFFRGVVADKVEGLADVELRGSVVPSGWTPAGLVNHLVNVERRWLRWGFLAEPVPDPWRDAAADAGWVTPGRARPSCGASWRRPVCGPGRSSRLTSSPRPQRWVAASPTRRPHLSCSGSCCT